MLGVKHKIAGAARTTGFVTAGTVLGMVGTGFLTVATWIYLQATFDALVAASTIGCVYLGLGFLLLGVGLSSSSSRKRSEGDPQTGAPQAESPAQLVVLSFLQGLEQGQQARRGMGR